MPLLGHRVAKGVSHPRTFRHSWKNSVSPSVKTLKHQWTLAVFMALGALSTSLQRKAVIQVKEDWQETPNLYLLSLLGSGCRKSVVADLARKPLDEWRREQQKGFWRPTRQIENRSGFQ